MNLNLTSGGRVHAPHPDAPDGARCGRTVSAGGRWDRTLAAVDCIPCGGGPGTLALDEFRSWDDEVHVVGTLLDNGDSVSIITELRTDKGGGAVRLDLRIRPVDTPRFMDLLAEYVARRGPRP